MATFLALSTAFIVGFLLTPILILILKKMKMIDAPGGRKIHTGFIPSMGGVGFVIGTFVATITWASFQELVEIRFFLTAFGLTFLLGLRDDMVDLKPWQKLLGQLVASYMVVVFGDIRISGLYGFMGIYEIPLIISYAISIFTIVALTNSFNLIDGLDGLAGSLSLVAFTFLGWWFLQANMNAYSLFAFVLVGGILSFLIYNWHPAKIFMGDTGSLSLGFALSVMAVIFVDRNGTMAVFEGWKFNAPIASGFALLIVPVYDTCRIFTKRIRRGKSPFSADKSHIHHFMMRMGLRHDQVALSMSGIMLFFIAVMFLGTTFSDYIMLPLVILTAVVLGLRLDVITLRRVKEIQSKTPPILSLKKSKRSSKGAPEIAPKIIKKIEMNQN
ncbi:undecaprenyl/decaprenyl-phosphate alpha-N-acetylglucosaminyl 1-phosphate transferase [Belliella kenyensis]|uniref:Undecaprenyl/decaprenyl-phosphate alpha-N-acetylglucosaminyl 1-phosphate transferase n=1 Tax=Belliella kenyensis TaxID=1472724 RepID=A0ABV8EI44_9BACT|nr:undecaprenyl/decaprenyl-phosphate alpha-N-acetylglucosaminyl 1-phosphate transferase [Belliella kenyensis]MCH7401747.1 undecaprenyl/decaprenyl-phosphate alpha-N-acetylglucosaminyl 1-phosphate transferase [Belliella kenyensis]